MTDWIDQQNYDPSKIYKTSAADALVDLDCDEQFAVICAEFKKPKRIETVRRKLQTYWRIISNWQDERPDLFDACLYAFVAEMEERNASAPDGIR